MDIYILISNIINIFTRIFFFALILRIILSWINISPYNPISRITYQITEPLLGKIRRYVKPFGMFDFSPMIAIISLQILEIIANRILMFFAN
jgi:YggT family protein